LPNEFFNSRLRQAKDELAAIDKRVESHQFKINCLRCEVNGEAPPENQPLLKNALIDGEAEEIRQLKHQLKQTSDQLSNSRQTVNKASKDIKDRDQEISKLRKQLNQLTVNPSSRPESRNSVTRKQGRSGSIDTSFVESSRSRSIPIDDISTPTKKTPKKHNLVFTPTHSGHKFQGRDAAQASQGKPGDDELKYTRGGRANKLRTRRNKKDKFGNSGSEIDVPKVSVNLQMDEAIIDVGRIVVNLPTPSSTSADLGKPGEQPKLPSWNELSTASPTNAKSSDKVTTAMSKPRLPLVSYRPGFKESSDASKLLASKP